MDYLWSDSLIILDISSLAVLAQVLILNQHSPRYTDGGCLSNKAIEIGFQISGLVEGFLDGQDNWMYKEFQHHPLNFIAASSHNNKKQSARGGKASRDAFDQLASVAAWENQSRPDLERLIGIWNHMSLQQWSGSRTSNNFISFINSNNPDQMMPEINSIQALPARINR